jgi:hypothetical protein
MKEYIVRAPQTDRLKISVPTQLAELNDPAGSLLVSHATGSTTGSTNVEPFAIQPLALDTYGELVGASSSSGKVAVSVAGWFLIIATAQWGVGGGSPVTDRGIHIYVNGSSVGELRMDGPIDYLHSDQFSLMYRLAVGDVVQAYAKNYTGTLITVETSRLQLARLAP